MGLTIIIGITTMVIALNGLLFQPKKDINKPTSWRNTNLFGKTLFALIVLLAILNIVKALYDDDKRNEEINNLLLSQKELKEDNLQLLNDNKRLENVLSEFTETIISEIRRFSTKTAEKDRILASITDRRKEAINLAFAFQERQIPFKWGGKNPEEGFDSSSFAAYLLGQLNLIQNPETYWSERLRNELGSKKYNDEEELEIGDILFYEAGVCMFYLGENRCIGMLPGGVVIKELYFGFEKLGYARLDYS